MSVVVLGRRVSSVFDSKIPIKKSGYLHYPIVALVIAHCSRVPVPPFLEPLRAAYFTKLPSIFQVSVARVADVVVCERLA
jgi:hypothetical protein